MPDLDTASTAAARRTALDRLRHSSIEPDSAGGVPMVLALLDHRGAVPRPVAAADEQVRRHGARTAAEVDRLHHLLAPGFSSPDARTTHLLHAEASLTTFRPAPEPGPAARRSPASPPPREGGASASPPGPEVLRTALEHGSVLRVVNFHLTPESSRDRLRTALGVLSHQFSTVGVDHLDHFFDTGSWPTERPPAVPVFYEGYASSASVAAQVCDDLGLTAWFAVCTAFLDCPPEQQEVFARAHWIALDDSELDGRRLAMTWDDVRDLAARHVVFPHTASHAGIADVVTDDDLHREVAEPLARVREVTGRDHPLHAWFLGTAFGAGPRHDDALRRAGYRYVVSNTAVQRIG